MLRNVPLFTPEERVGTTVSERYRLNRLLATGGMGVVYEGEHLLTGRPVAVKMLKAQFALSKEANFRFLREARAAAALSHPNIIEVIDVGEAEDGTPYQVLELLEGKPLTEFVKQGQSLEPEWIVDALLPVMDALHSAHCRGVVHRDLKPDNIYISRNSIGEVIPKVLDFGIAKFGDSSISGALPIGTIMGTPHYMAPEQASGKRNIGVPADIWAMGVVLLEAFAGVHPAAQESSTTLLIRIATRGLPSAMTVCPHIHSALAAAIDRALAHAPEERWPTMTEFCEATYQAAVRAKVAGSYVPVAHRGVESGTSAVSDPLPLVRVGPRPVSGLQARPERIVSKSHTPSSESRPKSSSKRSRTRSPASRGAAHVNLGSHSKIKVKSGQLVTAVRPDHSPGRTRVFDYLRSVGLLVDEDETIPLGTSDEEAVSLVLKSQNKILLVPFHGKRDDRGNLVDGLRFVRKLQAACAGRFRWRVIMPTTALGAASVELALAREPVPPDVKQAILVIPEEELAARELAMRIQRHVYAA